MQIHIVQRDTRAKLSIINTNKGREALKCDEPTPRERQLLLLLDKEDSELSKQAVELLLTKVDLNKIARKGWVEYHVLDDHAVTVNPSDKHDFELNFSHEINQSDDPKVRQKKIKSFLTAYSSDEPPVVTPLTGDLKSHLEAKQTEDTPYHTNVQIDQSLDKQIMINQNVAPISLPEPVADNFDDLMIIQTLLNLD
ncbi:hypothetical protein [Faucicola boevrei]|uniref:hypothetical protein n=1 Tax=Faucicola boevrei TaxID=346665 RepID=UPI0003801429|nr:hypothetical protein [Moraxella boevrei]